MADFHKAFEAIDEDGSGEITVEELQHYMRKNNYKENFVSKWLTLFDSNKSGKITYRHYCETLGLVPRQREVSATEKGTEGNCKNDEEMISPTTNVTEHSDDVDNKIQKRKQRKSQSYPIQVMKRLSKHKSKPFSQHRRTLRPNCQPGSILILLSGLHRGKRVIFLKQLNSGLLLVTGPYKLNGCPLRRIHQNMVIVTKTRLNIDDIVLSDYLNDQYFARKENDQEKKMTTDVSNIFTKTKKHYTLKEQRKEDQKLVDNQILNAIKKRNDKSMLKKYLQSLFTLSSHDYPHKMEF